MSNLTPTRRNTADHYDAIVVGARAAGAATAMLLARQGLRVLTIDRAAAGADTLSSHALMRGAVNRLAEWGLLERVWRAGTPVISRTVFHYGSERFDIDIPVTDGVAGLAAPRRTVLDPILVDAALEAGARVLHEARLLDVEFDASGRVTGVHIAASDRTVRRVTTDLLVGADGLHSLVARRVNAPVTRQGVHASAYVLQHIAGAELDRDAYHWLYEPGMGAGVIPTNDDGWCVFAAMPPREFVAVRSEPRAAMLSVLRQLDPALACAVDAARPLGPVRSWPGTPGRFLKPQGPGWALVGDAGYFKDPFAAHGITDAFRDASLLARAVHDGDFGRYEATRDELSVPLFDVLERIASYSWTLDSVAQLHLALSRAMRDEEAALQAELPAGAVAAAG